MDNNNADNNDAGNENSNDKINDNDLNKQNYNNTDKPCVSFAGENSSIYTTNPSTSTIPTNSSTTTIPLTNHPLTLTKPPTPTNKPHTKIQIEEDIPQSDDDVKILMVDELGNLCTEVGRGMSDERSGAKDVQLEEVLSDDNDAQLGVKQQKISKTRFLLKSLPSARPPPSPPPTTSPQPSSTSPPSSYTSPPPLSLLPSLEEEMEMLPEEESLQRSLKMLEETIRECRREFEKKKKPTKKLTKHMSLDQAILKKKPLKTPLSAQVVSDTAKPLFHQSQSQKSFYEPLSASFNALPPTAIRNEKVIVFIRVVFLKIGEIDTMKENFVADAFIQARWREPLLDGLSHLNPDSIDWRSFWNPKVFVENSFNEPKETVWQTVSFNSRGDAMVYEKRRIRGCFIENLELDDFPFDTQDLTLTVTSERSENELELEEDTDEISSINVQSFVDEQEWKLHSHVETWKKITTKTYQISKAKHPAFATSCRATRRPGFFVWNIFLVMLFICSLTFSTFCVDLMKLENRLQLSFILLLTTVTFKFVVSQTLPRISYLTLLDKYILISMAILCTVCVWHAVVFSSFRHDLHLARTLDWWALIVSASGYALFHLFFFFCIYLGALRKRWKYDKKDKEHKDRIKRLQRLQELARNNFDESQIKRRDNRGLPTAEDFK